MKHDGLADRLKAAAQEAVGAALADEVQEVVAKEIRRAFRDHEEQITALVRSAVADALTEAFRPTTEAECKLKVRKRQRGGDELTR